MSEHHPMVPRPLESTLVIGGTGFIVRHTVEQSLAHGYDVTTMSRGEQLVHFDDRSSVVHVTGDRSDPDAIQDAA